jgi:hypothetical protein
MSSSIKPNFSGPYKDVLTELADAVESITSDHGTSFVKAGDNKVYALGGNGYVIVLDEDGWGGLVEILTPKATITARPGDGGAISVASDKLDEASIKALLKETSKELRAYYEKRYWRTPKIA